MKIRQVGAEMFHA